jgi:hypothetical protein
LRPDFRLVPVMQLMMEGNVDFLSGTLTWGYLAVAESDLIKVVRHVKKEKYKN